MAKNETSPHAQLLNDIFKDLNNPNNSKNKSQFSELIERHSETLQEFWRRDNLEQIPSDCTFHLINQDNGSFWITRQTRNEIASVNMTPNNQITTIKSEIKLDENNESRTSYNLSFRKGIISRVDKILIETNQTSGISEVRKFEQIIID